MTEKEIQPIAIDGKIIDFKTKEVIEDFRMTEKQWKIVGEEFISYYGGDAYLISNGDCRFHVWERKEDAQKVCDKLNELTNENKALKSMNKLLLTEIRDKITVYLEMMEGENE